MRIIKSGRNRYHIILSDEKEPKGWRDDYPAAKKYALAERSMLLYALFRIPMPPRPNTKSFEYALRVARSKFPCP